MPVKPSVKYISIFIPDIVTKSIYLMPWFLTLY